MNRIRRHLSPATVLAATALFVAVGTGGAFAAVALIDGAQLKNRSVAASKLRLGSVSTAQLANAGVTAAKLKGGSVVAAKLATGSVTAAKLGAGSVDASKLAAASVGAAALADGTVGAVELADGAVGSAKLVDGAVTAAKVADGAIGAAELADGSVTSAKVADGAITRADLAPATVPVALVGRHSVPTALLVTSLPFATTATAALAEGRYVVQLAYRNALTASGPTWSCDYHASYDGGASWPIVSVGGESTQAQGDDFSQVTRTVGPGGETVAYRLECLRGGTPISLGSAELSVVITPA